MPTFKDLRIWQEAYELMLEVHQIAVRLPRLEWFSLKPQVERSSSSIVDNIAEGYTSYYYNDKIKGMYVARKEIGETQSHLMKMEGKGYVKSPMANGLCDRYQKLIAGINGFVRYIRKKRGDKR